ncbi:unnamed protein product [Amoebophrya sp. A120]|nr:unnamed protein product [Amoebophrya sp. A120]|eukprot:GSA120T00015666001.1
MGRIVRRTLCRSFVNITEKVLLFVLVRYNTHTMPTASSSSAKCAIPPASYGGKVQPKVDPVGSHANFHSQKQPAFTENPVSASTSHRFFPRYERSEFHTEIQNYDLLQQARQASLFTAGSCGSSGTALGSTLGGFGNKSQTRPGQNDAASSILRSQIGQKAVLQTLEGLWKEYQQRFQELQHGLRDLSRTLVEQEDLVPLEQSATSLSNQSTPATDTILLNDVAAILERLRDNFPVAIWSQFLVDLGGSRETEEVRTTGRTPSSGAKAVPGVSTSAPRAAAADWYCETLETVLQHVAAMTSSLPTSAQGEAKIGAGAEEARLGSAKVKAASDPAVDTGADTAATVLAGSGRVDVAAPPAENKQAAQEPEFLANVIEDCDGSPDDVGPSSQTERTAGAADKREADDFVSMWMWLNKAAGRAPAREDDNGNGEEKTFSSRQETCEAEHHATGQSESRERAVVDKDLLMVDRSIWINATSAAEEDGGLHVPKDVSNTRDPAPTAPSCAAGREEGVSGAEGGPVQDELRSRVLLVGTKLLAQLKKVAASTPSSSTTATTSDRVATSATKSGTMDLSAIATALEEQIYRDLLVLRISTTNDKSGKAGKGSLRPASNTSTATQQRNAGELQKQTQLEYRQRVAELCEKMKKVRSFSLLKFIEEFTTTTSQARSCAVGRSRSDSQDTPVPQVDSCDAMGCGPAGSRGLATDDAHLIQDHLVKRFLDVVLFSSGKEKESNAKKVVQELPGVLQKRTEGTAAAAANRVDGRVKQGLLMTSLVLANPKSTKSTVGEETTGSSTAKLPHGASAISSSSDHSTRQENKNEKGKPPCSSLLSLLGGPQNKTKTKASASLTLKHPLCHQNGSYTKTARRRLDEDELELFGGEVSPEKGLDVVQESYEKREDVRKKKREAEAKKHELMQQTKREEAQLSDSLNARGSTAWFVEKINDGSIFLPAKQKTKTIGFAAGQQAHFATGLVAPQLAAQQRSLHAEKNTHRGEQARNHSQMKAGPTTSLNSKPKQPPPEFVARINANGEREVVRAQDFSEGNWHPSLGAKRRRVFSGSLDLED